jgi:uncharacterized coiled-coil DUF342 family protein
MNPFNDLLSTNNELSLKVADLIDEQSELHTQLEDLYTVYEDLKKEYEEFKSNFHVLKEDLEYAKKDLIITRHILDSIPKWIVNLFYKDQY